eukprot:UN14734
MKEELFLHILTSEELNYEAGKLIFQPKLLKSEAGKLIFQPSCINEVGKRRNLRFAKKETKRCYLSF